MFSNLIKINKKTKGKTMKFKFTDQQGNNYEVEVRARDNRNLNASKKATQIVLTEIANLINCAAYQWHKEGCTNSAEYAQLNANNIIDIVL